MKISQLLVAGLVLAALATTTQAQNPYAGPAMMAGGYGPQMPYGPQMAGGSIPSPDYQQFDAQQAMYGPGGPLSGPPMPMDGYGGGCGGPGGCGGAGCPSGCINNAECFDDGGGHFAYVSAEVFYARHTNMSHNAPLVVDSATQSTALVSTNDFGFTYQPGEKFIAGYYFSRGIGVEGTFWGDFDQTSLIQTNSAVPALSVPGAIGAGSTDFTNVDDIRTIYRSRIHNAEINMILPYGSWQWLAGTRYMEINEKLTITGTDTLGGTSADYTITTGNYLYGGQVGARGQWEIGRFIVDAECKAGVFSNSCNQFQTITDPTTPRSGGAREHQVAFVGEVATYLLLPIGSNFTGKLGYTGIWVTDIALAPDQIDFSTATAPTGIDTRGSTIVHGFNAGVEYRW